MSSGTVCTGLAVTLIVGRVARRSRGDVAVDLAGLVDALGRDLGVRRTRAARRRRAARALRARRPGTAGRPAGRTCGGLALDRRSWAARAGAAPRSAIAVAGRPAAAGSRRRLLAWGPGPGAFGSRAGALGSWAAALGPRAAGALGPRAATIRTAATAARPTAGATPGLGAARRTAAPVAAGPPAPIARAPAPVAGLVGGARQDPAAPDRRHLAARWLAREPAGAAEARAARSAAGPAAPIPVAPIAAAAVAPPHAGRTFDEVVEVALLLRARRRALTLGGLEHPHTVHVVEAIADGGQRLVHAREPIAREPERGQAAHRARRGLALGRRRLALGRGRRALSRRGLTQETRGIA